jgi:DNA-directed RNA polymerase sigma subunit (sigma70/sigma32)
MEGRFGLHGHDEMTLDVIGKEFGITRERVRQLEKKIREIIQNDPILQAFSPRNQEVVNAAA